MNSETSVIAFVTDDGSTISAHFGRAQYYEIVTLADGAVSDRRRLPKAGHHTYGGGEDGHAGRGHDQQQTEKHTAMTVPLAGVDVLIARGMGMGAQQHLTSSGIRTVLTDLHTIDEAVEHYLAGTLRDNPERLHRHGSHHGH